MSTPNIFVMILLSTREARIDINETSFISQIFKFVEEVYLT